MDEKEGHLKTLSMAATRLSWDLRSSALDTREPVSSMGGRVRNSQLVYPQLSQQELPSGALEACWCLQGSAVPAQGKAPSDRDECKPASDFKES